MAVNLNISPGFRQDRDKTTGKKIQLLPPSSFAESSSGFQGPGPSALKELASATSEILSLKQQNQHLRECKQVNARAGEDVKAQVDLQHVLQSALPSRHLDEIINRQAAEISQLRERLQMTEGQYQRQVARLEGQMVIKDAECQQQVSALQQQVKNVSEQREDEITYLRSTSDRELTEHRNRIQHLETDIEKKTSAHKKIVEQLERNMTQVQEEYRQYQAKSQREISQAELNAENFKTQLDQQKKYLSETEQTARSTQVWKKQLDTLQNQIQILEAEKSNLESSFELVNIRQKSQNEILIIQEQQLSQVKESSNEKKKGVLLTRWREKVFELLVQLESGQITLQNTQRNYNYKVQSLEDEVEKERKVCELLQHTLTDRQAQFDMEVQKVQRLENELMSAQALAIQLDDRNAEYQHTIRALVDFSNSVYEKYCSTEKAMADVQSKLTAYNNRISFASGRVEVLQSQFARKLAHLKVELEEKYQANPTTDHTEEKATDTLTALQLAEELDRVQRERDQLAAQIKHDADLLEQKVISAKQQVADELYQLKHLTTELHTQMEQKNLKLEALEEALESSLKENEEYKTTLEQIQVEMGKIQVQHDTDLETVKLEAQSQATEQLAEMEHRLNEARREHTKAVVSLRQTERQSEREKEKMSKERTRLEDYYKGHIFKLEENLKRLECDRNLLMTTLRQEGIVGKYKAQRASPVQLHLGLETETLEEQDTEERHSETETKRQDSISGSTSELEQVEVPLTATRDTYFEDSGDLPPQTPTLGTENELEELQQLGEEVLEDSDSSV